MTDNDSITTAAFSLIQAMIAAGQVEMETQIGPVQQGDIDHGTWRVKVERVGKVDRN